MCKQWNGKNAKEMRERIAEIFVYQRERKQSSQPTYVCVSLSQVYKSHYVYSSVNHRQAKWQKRKSVELCVFFEKELYA